MCNTRKHFTPPEIERFCKEHFSNINLENNTHQLDNLDFHLFCTTFKLEYNKTKSGQSLRTEFYIGRKIHYVWTVLPTGSKFINEDWEKEIQKEELLLLSDERLLQ